MLKLILFLWTITLTGAIAQSGIDYVSVIKKAAPAIVNIFAEQVIETPIGGLFDDPLFAPFGGLTRQQIGQSLGSGVIVAAEGIVITCFHVVRNARRIKVKLDNAKVYDAEVVATDEQNDLAAIRLKGDKPASGFSTLPLGNSDTLEEGQPVIAMGWPFAVGRFTTHGIISNPSVRIHNRLLVGTDAPINPGNSGGALVDMKGMLVAIPNAIVSKSGASNGVGFGIPAKLVRAVLDALQKGQARVVRPWIGVNVQSIDEAISESLGIKTKGVLVQRIHPLSPALKAGLAQGDVITAINGMPIRDEEDFRFRLQTVSENDDIALKLIKGNHQESELKFQGIVPPKESKPIQTLIKDSHVLSGVTVANLSPDLAVQMGIDSTQEGVVVTKVAGGAMAAFFGIRPGDIVFSLGDHKIKDVKELLQKLRSLKQFALNIKRDNDILTLQVQ